MRHEQWLYFQSAIDSQWCDDFVKYCTESYEPQSATVGFRDDLTKSDYRECDIRWLEPHIETELVDTLWRYVDRANRDSFDVDVRYINELQFTTYKGKNEGRYGWHYDVNWRNQLPHHRKLSVTIQLSDHKDYEGGDFEFEKGVDELPIEVKEKGTILIFPSFYQHQVTPVTSGTRHSLVTWVEGPHWR